MQANQQRYRDDLRQPFIALMEQIAARHLRELDPRLDTVVKTNRVLASIRKGSPTRAASITSTSGVRSAGGASKRTCNWLSSSRLLGWR
jgi:hypothetical protein